CALPILGNVVAAAGVEEPARRFEANPGRADRAGPELDAGQVTFANSAQAHDEAGIARSAAGLVRVRDHRRVEQCRGLKRVFLSEIRSDQLPPGGPGRDLAAEAVRDKPEIMLQCPGQVAVPAGEPGQGAGDSVVDLLLAEVEDPV